jgi:hypothetical protein
MKFWHPALSKHIEQKTGGGYSKMTVIIEAESFEYIGGWVIDSQFIDLMGSPYLMANGMGKTIEDARTEVRIPESGRYRLWARTKDWFPESHPGIFRIILNGRPLEHIFGKSGQSGWQWEDGGVHEIAGNVEIRLHDLSGYYGRCDAILLTDDLDFSPPTGIDEIADLREQHGGVSREIRDMREYDVVVIGGGLAGCTAAVAAARNGAQTALVQNRPMLGGNASSEILVPPVGVWNGRKEGPFDPHETGIIEEYRTAGRQVATEGKLYSKRLLRFVQSEPNLDLHLNTHATGVEMQDKSNIEAVLALHARSGQRMRFPGRIFIDCSGDSAIAVSAGAEYRQGKESKSIHNEPWAPDAPSKHTMGNGLKYYPVDTGNANKFEAPAWIYRFPECSSFGPGRHPRKLGVGVMRDGKGIGHQWILELGGTQDTYAEAEEIRDDLFRLIYGIWDHLKNHCPENRDRAPTYELGWVGYIAGKRESRRLIGDHILTQNDIVNKTLFEDRVAYGGWVVDDHYSDGFFHKGQFGVHQDKRDYACFGEEFSIPFRSLYSRNIDNLMMAGRNISATHLAMSDTRVMLTCAIVGHAAGTGAAICIQKNATPRGLYQSHTRELQQQLLKEGAYIIDLKADDPRDLAQKARIWASSQRVRIDGQVMAAENVVNGYSRAEGEHPNAWCPAEGEKPPHWVEVSWDQPVSFNMVHVYFQTAKLSPEHFYLEVWHDGLWKKIIEVTENKHRRHILGLERITTSRIRIAVMEPRGICEIRIYDEPQELVENAHRAHSNMRIPDEGPFLPWEPGFQESYLSIS